MEKFQGERPITYLDWRQWRLSVWRASTQSVRVRNSTWIMIEALKSWKHMSVYHYSGIIMSMMASQITSLMIVYSTIYSGADQRNHQSSMSLAFVRGIHRWPMNSLHKGPVTQKMFPFDDVIMTQHCDYWCCTRPKTSSVATVLIKYSWYWTSFTLKHYSCREQN